MVNVFQFSDVTMPGAEVIYDHDFNDINVKIQCEFNKTASASGGTFSHWLVPGYHLWTPLGGFVPRFPTVKSKQILKLYSTIFINGQWRSVSDWLNSGGVAGSTVKVWRAVGGWCVSCWIRRTVGFTAAVQLLKLQRKLFLHHLQSTPQLINTMPQKNDPLCSLQNLLQK